MWFEVFEVMVLLDLIKLQFWLQFSKQYRYYTGKVVQVDVFRNSVITQLERLVVFLFFYLRFEGVLMGEVFLI